MYVMLCVVTCVHNREELISSSEAIVKEEIETLALFHQLYNDYITQRRERENQAKANEHCQSETSSHRPRRVSVTPLDEEVVDFSQLKAISPKKRTARRSLGERPQSRGNIMNSSRNSSTSSTAAIVNVGAINGNRAKAGSGNDEKDMETSVNDNMRKSASKKMCVRMCVCVCK